MCENPEVRIHRKQALSGLNFYVDMAESSRFTLCVYLTFCYWRILTCVVCLKVRRLFTFFPRNPSCFHPVRRHKAAQTDEHQEENLPTNIDSIKAWDMVCLQVSSQYQFRKSFVSKVWFQSEASSVFSDTMSQQAETKCTTINNLVEKLPVSKILN